MQKVVISSTYRKHEQKRLEYVLSFIQHHPLNPRPDMPWRLNENYAPGDLVIGYGDALPEASFAYCIPMQKVFFEKEAFLEHHYIITPNSYFTSDNQRIYSVETQLKQEQPLLKDRTFQFDLFETIFFHLSRYEEVTAFEADHNECGWLAEEKQLLVRNHLEKRPVVDELIRSFFEILFNTKIDRPCTYDLSHDIDVIYRFRPFYKFLRSIAATLYYRRGTDQLKKSFSHYLKMKSGAAADPYDSFDWLFRPEKDFAPRRLYLMSGGNTRYDNYYQVDSFQVTVIIQKARAKGYQVGLHPSFNAGLFAGMFAEEKRKLESVLKETVKYSRQHWLRFNWAVTPAIITQNQLLEDASIGFNDRLGFRCGTGFPYHLYDFGEEAPYPWRERPFALMESSAIHESRHTGKTVTEVLTQLLATNQRNTHLSLNFHNSNFDPTLETGRELEAFYRGFIIPK